MVTTGGAETAVAVLYQATEPTGYNSILGDEQRLFNIQLPNHVRPTTVDVLTNETLSRSEGDLNGSAEARVFLVSNSGAARSLVQEAAFGASTATGGLTCDLPSTAPDNGIKHLAVLIRESIQTITIYGYDISTSSAAPYIAPFETVPHPIILSYLIEQAGATRWSEGNMDMDRFMGWAGGTAGLLNTVAYAASTTFPVERTERLSQTAIQSLMLLPPSSVRRMLVSQPHAIPAVASMPELWESTLEYPVEDLDFDIEEYTNFVLRPDVVSTIPSSHPLYWLSITHPDYRQAVGWRRLEDPAAAIIVLRSIESEKAQCCGLLEAPPRKQADVENVRERAAERGTQSKLQLLLDAGRWHARQSTPPSAHTSQRLLNYLLHALESHDILSDTSTQTVLARSLPELVLRHNLRRGDEGAKRKNLNLEILLKCGRAAQRVVLEELVRLAVTVVDGQLAFTSAKSLARPFLKMVASDDLLSRFFALNATSSLTYSVDAAGGGIREEAMDTLSDNRYSSITSQLTTASDLILRIAPALHAALSTSRAPPLGIPVCATAASRTGAQASDYAGKVYTSHEFRNREARDKERDGMLSPPVSSAPSTARSTGMMPMTSSGASTPGLVPPVGAGAMSAVVGGQQQLQVGVMSGGGIGSVAGRLSRPASKHVDDYAR